MATSRQEKTYNEIIELYNYADKLIQEAESATHELKEQQFDIVEKVVEDLEFHADKLTTKYIEYVKSNEKSDMINEVRSNINNIIAKVQECKNKIIMLYNKK